MQKWLSVREIEKFSVIKKARLHNLNAKTSKAEAFKILSCQGLVRPSVREGRAKRLGGVHSEAGGTEVVQCGSFGILSAD